MFAGLIDNPWFYAAAIPAIVLTGVAKGGFGGGIGSLAVPLIALTIAPARAAAIMLPILMLMDAVGLYAYRGQWDRRIMRIILPAGLVGIVIGWLTFRFLADHWIRILLGVISLAFVIDGLRPTAPHAARASDTSGRIWATVSGFTSFVTHAGGPPLNFYLLRQQLDKVLFAGTTIVFFAVINATKVVPYLALGLFDATNLATSAVLAPAAAAGIVIGILLRKHISRTIFFRIVYGFVFVTGCKLLYDGMRTLLA
ncbi:MAG: sulfite exporter TauE/SafE family protein [Betaproteobacteria bacterium]|nr:sulfite exporter TauE/SafE family protein [Betaproteobacteria bacterium]